MKSIVLSCIGLLWLLGACARTQPAPAEHGQNSVDSARVWRDAHLAFTANQPSREYLLATGSSHKVMVDRPAVVVEAIRRMLDRVQRAR